MAWYRCMGDNSTGLSTLVAKPYNVVNGNYSTNNNVINYNIIPTSGYGGMSVQLVNLEVDKEYLITFDIFLSGTVPSNNYSWKMGIMDGTLMAYSGDYGNRSLYNDEVNLPTTDGTKKSFSFYVKPQSSTTTLYFCTSAANSNVTLTIDNFKYVNRDAVAPTPLQFKTWAHFDGTHALALDINIQASYDHKVTFEWYDAVQDEDGYRFSVYGANWLFCRRRGNNYWIGPGNGGTQTWAGNIGETHLMINNDEEHKNYIDGNYTGGVTEFTPSSTEIYNQYWIGGQYASGSSHAYVKQFKIESISTGDTICELVPCLFDNEAPYLYDKVNKRFYYVDGLTVMDSIPTS